MPAQEVGGDLFDFASPDHRKALCVSVVDVSGKGMQAAMAAVFTSGALASELKQNTTPAAILTDLNRAVFIIPAAGILSRSCPAVLSPREGVFTFANAGQTKPLLRAGATVQWLDSVRGAFSSRHAGGDRVR